MKDTAKKYAKYIFICLHRQSELSWMNFRIRRKWELVSEQISWEVPMGLLSCLAGILLVQYTVLSAETDLWDPTLNPRHNLLLDPTLNPTHDPTLEFCLIWRNKFGLYLDHKGDRETPYKGVPPETSRHIKRGVKQGKIISEGSPSKTESETRQE